MENLSPYEIAQKRIEQRQRKQNHAALWLVLAGLCIVLTFIASNCFLLPAIIMSVLGVLSGVDWYFSSNRRPPSQPLVNQEMAWLFGEGWEHGTGVHEFSLALERIQKRRFARVKFTFHLVLFLLVNAMIIGLMAYNLNRFNEAPPPLALTFSFAWLIILLVHAAFAFPGQKELARLERRAGAMIQRELEQLQSTKIKNDEKPKRYMLGDDGELVERDQEIIEGEKPKNNWLGDA